MSDLREFLKLNSAVVSAKVDVDIGGRLSGKPFTVRALSYDEWADIQQRSTTVGRDGRSKLNAGKLNELIVLACCVEPDFSSSDFIDDMGCKTPSELLHAVLLPGEIIDISKEISRISGFDNDFSELVDEAKN